MRTIIAFILIASLICFIDFQMTGYKEKTPPPEITTRINGRYHELLGDSIPGTWLRVYKGDTLKVIKTVTIQYHLQKQGNYYKFK